MQGSWRTRPRLNTVLAVVGLLLVLTACSNGSDDESATTVQTTLTPEAITTTTVPAETADGEPDLDGVSFAVSDISGYVPAGAAYLDLSFQNGTLAASLGCNILAAPYLLEGNQLKWTTEPRGEFTCSTSETADETRLRDLLTRGTIASVEGGVLTIEGAGASISFSQVEPTPLEDTVWYLHGTISDGAALATPSGSLPTLQMVRGDTARMTTECDNGLAVVAIEEGSINFSDPLWDGLSCTQETTMSAAENAMLKDRFQQVLDGHTDFTIGAQTLIIKNDDQGLILRRA